VEPEPWELLAAALCCALCRSEVAEIDLRELELVAQRIWLEALRILESMGGLRRCAVLRILAGPSAMSRLSFSLSGWVLE